VRSTPQRQARVASACLHGRWLRPVLTTEPLLARAWHNFPQPAAAPLAARRQQRGNEPENGRAMAAAAVARRDRSR
jgi:hypothetical protein